jgi:hypothetical protein
MGTLFLVIGIVFVLSFIPLAYAIARAYRRFRGPRVVTCPETGTAVAVELNAGKAAFTGAFDEPELRLSSCSRWPERQDCGQECVKQIEEAPDGCLVREKLAAWYGRPLRPLRPLDRPDPLDRPQAGTPHPRPEDDRLERDRARRASGRPVHAQAGLLELPPRRELPSPVP